MWNQHTTTMGILFDLLVHHADDMRAAKDGDQAALERVASTAPYSRDQVSDAVQLYAKTAELILARANPATR